MNKPKPVISTYKHDGLKITLQTNQHHLHEVLEAFEHVLRGSGFVVGKIIIEDSSE